MTLATTSGAQLTADLKPQLNALVEDMRSKLEDDADLSAQWRATHQRAVSEERTASSWTDYVEDQLTQAAVGWLLTSVFVRFCEDNLLLGPTAVWISGPTSTLRQRARDAENQFYRDDPERSYREWLEVSFDALRENPGTKSLLDDHAAIAIIEPTSFAVEKLLEYWRRTDDDGELIWRFDDPDLSTRFLGDMYQDLSDYAKKKYALLQTPEFVEEFILDQTMEPALKDRPLEGFSIIDPTCGSGHFLLGAFSRLVKRWEDAAPGMEPRARVDKALSSVNGVDINPFAVAIAKFRLIVAAMQAAGEPTLVNVPRYTLNLAAGNTLLYKPLRGNAKALDYRTSSDSDPVADLSGYALVTEDRDELYRILTSESHDVVVGNPPYITVKDKTLNARYREIYQYCKGKYALTVPFMEGFFDLAKRGDRPGWVGQITSNSFMKREFGVPIIEEFLARKDLRLVVDTSGAYIPGHGTPTVVIVGRNAESASDVRAVLGIQGEPGTPADPAKGKVWTSIVDHADAPGYEDQWISVADLPRSGLSAHPWSLTGGGAVELLARIDDVRSRPLSGATESIGITSFTLEDSVYLVDQETIARRGISQSRPMVLGDQVRDWSLSVDSIALFPYDSDFQPIKVENFPAEFRFFWPYRVCVSNSKMFGGETKVESGLSWAEYGRLTVAKLRTPLSITFAEVATHNHFVLDRGGKVFKQTAPVIKLSEGASEEDHLRLLGVLNSSTACFWLKQNCHNKGSTVDSKGARTTLSAWENFYQYNGTTLKDFPLSAAIGFGAASAIDELSRALKEHEPDYVLEGRSPTDAILARAFDGYQSIREHLVASQEELDWQAYRWYGIIDEDLSGSFGGVTPKVKLGERAFEIDLARRAASGELETTWFERHGSTPITEIPAHWPEDYKALVQRRLDAIESNPHIRLLEKPEYKRRWASESWESKVQRALRDWLLDRLENPKLWANQQGVPQPRSVGEIAGVVARDPEVIEALDLWAGRKDAPVADTLVKLLADQTVPYLAAYRYKDSGLRKRAEWEHVWDLQRAEDRGEVKAADIPVPPKYATADFRKQSYWSHRGKLDVPKERFILYPDAGRATDPTPLLGWAGWNHAEQGLALATIFALRESEGVDTSVLVPMVAGLSELLPWVKQWHSGPDPKLGIDLADYLGSQLQEKAQQIGVPVPELSKWRPAAPVRGRKKKADA
ncbi:BREX-2 system adenine-specific DNA-methyltransferase PglX [Gordonia sp. MMO-8]|uniref:BREX-2 system adenine-specific DNA-methyltransferase PglX n=1 Tax=Gordonia sp. MMO-8 TaxID=3127886 RepID=UPI0030189F15